MLRRVARRLRTSALAHMAVLARAVSCGECTWLRQGHDQSLYTKHNHEQRQVSQGMSGWQTNSVDGSSGRLTLRDKTVHQRTLGASPLGSAVCFTSGTLQGALSPRGGGLRRSAHQNKAWLSAIIQHRTPGYGTLGRHDWFGLLFSFRGLRLSSALTVAGHCSTRPPCPAPNPPTPFSSPLDFAHLHPQFPIVPLADCVLGR